eukprot:738223-Heterocapsa_arctica.AAC.1
MKELRTNKNYKSKGTYVQMMTHRNLRRTHSRMNIQSVRRGIVNTLQTQTGQKGGERLRTNILELKSQG